MSALSEMGGRIGRHAAIYGSGNVLTLVFGLINVAVLTRYLETGEFGEFAILLIFAALLTILYNAGSLQGSFRWIFGSTGEEELDSGAPPKAADDKRRALGSALVLTTLIAGTGTGLIVLLAPELSHLLVGRSDDSELVILAGASGGLGSVWRLASNVLRLQRRPTAYVVVSATRAVFVLALAIPLVSTGHGAEGAMAGVAGGTALSLAVTLIVIRDDFRLALARVDVVNIFRLGRIWVISIVALWVMHNGDLFLLSRYASDADVGLYRVASRMGALMSYLVSAFLMAWGPLSADAISAAVDRERGLKQAGATLTTYFVLASSAALLALAVFADLLVRVAPPAYADAAPLIPLVGAGFVFYGGFVVVFRTATLPRKQLTHIVLIVVSVCAFLAAALLLIPAWGSYGAAVATMIGPAVGMGIILVLAHRGEAPVLFDYRRNLGGVTLAGACLLAAKAAGQFGDPWQPLGEIAACLAFPLLLLLTGVVPGHHVRSLGAIARSTVGWDPPRRGVDRRVEELSKEDVHLIDELLTERRAPGDMASTSGRSEADVQGDYVRVLRKLGNVGSPSPADARIGAYLLSSSAAADRNAMAKELWSSDVDPLELDSLTLTAQALGRNRRWARPGRRRLASVGPYRRRSS